MKTESSAMKIPTWFWIVAILGLLWNVFGVFQFVQSVLSTKESLISMGMTESQAEVMQSYPIWMTVAFAIGTIGGLLGTIFLFIRKKIATVIFVVSLVGYVVLYIGDITEGIFEALGLSQVIILTSVVLIAAGLVWVSRYSEKTGLLK